MNKLYCCPHRDFAKKVKSQEALQLLAHILSKVLTVEVYSQYASKNLDLLKQGPHGIVGQSRRFHCLSPQVGDGQDDENRKSRRDCLIGRFCDIYCTVILQYSFALHAISNILWSSCYVSYGPKDTGEVIRCI